MEITDDTIKYALGVLDSQKALADDHPGDREQRAYYDGILKGINLLIENNMQGTAYSVVYYDNAEEKHKVGQTAN